MLLAIVEVDAFGTPAMAAPATKSPQKVSKVALRTKPVIVAPP